MVTLANVFRSYLGWCPNAPAMHKAQPVLSVFPATVLERPDGGNGGNGGIGRGIRFTIESVKVLNRNRSLLWFALLAGLVAGTVFSIQYGVGLLASYPYDAIDFPRWLVLTFCTGFFATFSINVLMAGLLLCLSPVKGRAVLFREGLSRVKAYLRPLADWSVILALWCTALFALLPFLGYCAIPYPGFSVLSPLTAVADIFPFRFIFLPELYHIGPIGGTYAMLYALTSTITMAALVLFLTVITLFVMPLLVLENRSLPEAVAGSFHLVKKLLAETLTVLLTVGVALIAASLLSLFFEVLYRFVAPEMQLFWYPGHGWVAAGVLFMLLLSALAFTGWTVAGIATMNLYRYAKTGRVSGDPEGEKRALRV
ncbi:MAG TPA: hypothetical protein P5217_01530 [Methanoregulaceae archaeon]|nr:hypothetical protein [Methanoregulaceae archaeon]